MLDIDAALVFSPHYRIVKLPSDRWAFLGHGRDFVMSADQLGDLVPEPGATIVPRSRLRSGDIAQDVMLLLRIERLVDVGVLVPQAAHARCAGAAIQGSGSIEVARDVLKRLGWPPEARVIFADRAIHAELAARDRDLRNRGEAWVLVVLEADRLWIGPRFDSRDPDRPCFACYAELLRHNQPLRRWLLHHHGAIPEEAPPHPRGDLWDALGRIANPTSVWAEIVAAPIVLEIGESPPGWTRHSVHRLSRCPGCGPRAEFEAQPPSERPIVLRSTPARFLDDGGFRVRSADETLARLRAWISPKTGLFREVRRISADTSSLRVHRASYSVCPLARVVVDGASFAEVALGKGLSGAQSEASALGEATERLAACYRGDERFVIACARDLPSEVVLPHAIAPFSDRQYRAFEAGGQAPPDAVLRYRDDLRIEWTTAWSLVSEAPRWVPASYCYTHAPLEGTRYCRFTSNGGAAGSSLEEAILQGLLEVVERDAVAVWWYGRIDRPVIPRMAGAREEANRVDATLGEAWTWWALDLTHDFDLPVAAAVAQHRRTGRAALGFGCHVDARLALRRALTELCQLVAHDVTSDPSPRVQERAGALDLGAIAWESHLLPNHGTSPSFFAALPAEGYIDLRDAVLKIAARAQRLGLDVLVHDYDRPDLPLQAVKVIVPGAGHFWPRLGGRRLYEVPVAMRWIEQPRREDDLNPVPLWL